MAMAPAEKLCFVLNVKDRVAAVDHIIGFSTHVACHYICNFKRYLQSILHSFKSQALIFRLTAYSALNLNYKYSEKITNWLTS